MSLTFKQSYGFSDILVSKSSRAYEDYKAMEYAILFFLAEKVYKSWWTWWTVKQYLIWDCDAYLFDSGECSRKCENFRLFSIHSELCVCLFPRKHKCVGVVHRIRQWKIIRFELQKCQKSWFGTCCYFISTYIIETRNVNCGWTLLLFHCWFSWNKITLQYDSIKLFSFIYDF